MDKTKHTLGILLLFIVAVTSLIFTLLLIFYQGFGPRILILSQSIKDPQVLLAGTISLFGVLSGGFIAAIALLYVNRQTQTYSWRRDQALKDIERIFEPLYQDISKVVEATESLDDLPTTSANWDTIISSYLGTILNLRSKEIYQESQALFEKVESYGERRRAALTTIRQTAGSIIDNTRLSDSGIPRDIINLILADMPGSLNYEGYIYQGFLAGKTAREWSSLKFRGESEYLLKQALEYMKGKSYWQHLNLTIAETESLLNELYHQSQNNPKIKEFRGWCKGLNGEATQLKSRLAACPGKVVAADNS
jgi:hypothetical protein